MKAIPEDDIIRQLQEPQTQRKAFEQVVNQFGQALYWQIRRMVGSHDDADDVLQNTFVKAWLHISSFRGDAKLSTWLHKIAYNETLTFLARQPDTVSIDDDTGRGGDDDDASALTLADTLQSDPDFDGDRTEALLQAAIAALPAKQKAVFTMKYYDEMKYEDMAQVTGTSVGALKASYHIAAKKIEDFVRRQQ